MRGGESLERGHENNFMASDGCSEAEMLHWKREYNIRQREAEWKKRQDEMLMQKQVAWEVLRLEKENRLAAAREAARRKHCEDRLRMKQEEVEREYKEKCRDVAMQKRIEHWETKENQKICEQVSATRQEDEAKMAQEVKNKESRSQELLEATTQRAEKKRQDKEVSDKREQAIQQKEMERKAREAERAHNLKSEACTSREMNSARFSKGYPASVRSVLKSVSAPLTTQKLQLELKRQSNLERMSKERDEKEVARIKKCKARLQEENKRFTGSTEQDIIHGRVPIFGTMA